MAVSNTKTIETSHLLLRPFTQADLNDLATLNGDTEVMQYISAPLSQEQVAGIIEWFIAEWHRLGYGWFALFEKATETFVGQCGLQCLEGRPDTDDVELAFVISRVFWGRGYATEAAQAVLTFGFEEVNLERIVAVTMPENTPSQRVLNKLGFHYEGNRQLYERTVMYYSLRREEYAA